MHAQVVVCSCMCVYVVVRVCVCVCVHIRLCTRVCECQVRVHVCESDDMSCIVTACGGGRVGSIIVCNIGHCIRYDTV